MTVNFPPWERFFDFPFWSYSCFRKKIRLTAQKVFPLPTVGAPSASNSPSALSAQALRAGQLSFPKGCTRGGFAKVCRWYWHQSLWPWFKGKIPILNYRRFFHKIWKLFFYVIFDKTNPIHNHKKTYLGWCNGLRLRGLFEFLVF